MLKIKYLVSVLFSSGHLLIDYVNLKPKSRAMGTESEKQWLLDAIDGFGENFIVVSPDFEIVAARSLTISAYPFNIIGRKCFDVFHERSSPCINCAIEKVKEQDNGGEIDVKSKLGVGTTFSIRIPYI